MQFVGYIAAGVCIALLVTVLALLMGMRGTIAELQERLARVPRSPDAHGPLERMSATLVNLQEQVHRIDLAVGTLERHASRPAPMRPADLRPDPVAPSPPPPPPPLPPVQPVGPSPAAARPEFLPPQPFRPVASDVMRHPDQTSVTRPAVVDTAPDTVLVDAYRALIAQPRKQDIYRWCEDAGGLNGEIAGDGSFQQVDRDAGGLLVLIPLNDRRALVLPGGRMVVDFATNYANPISMRSITRDAFQLSSNGTGMLRLLEPAYAERRDGIWHLTSAGRLDGLIPD